MEVAARASPPEATEAIFSEIRSEFQEHVKHFLEGVGTHALKMGFYGT